MIDAFHVPRAPAILGILYAENFDQEAPPTPDAPAAPPLPPPVTQADLDDACRRAVDAAAAAWAQDAQHRRTHALEGIALALADARAAALEHAEAVGAGIARLALDLVAGVLPHLCRAHGDQEVQMLVRRLVPILATRPTLVVRVHPGLVDTLRADLEPMHDAIVELRPANLVPGDVRLSWEDGSLVRDTAATLAAMEDALAQLGLLEAPRTPATQAVPTTQAAPIRNLALAQ